MHKRSKTYLVGRDSKTGQFVPAKDVYQHPKSYVVERIPKSTSIPKELRYVVTPKKTLLPKRKSKAK